MFQKNLDVLTNLALKERLQKISLEESKVGITYCVTPTNDYVLLKDEVASDDLNNPKKMVKETIANNIKTNMKENDIIIAFGIGLGYLLDELYTNFSSKIFIYEPDLLLLHFVLHNIDITTHLKSGRVFITNDLDELLKKISSEYITKDKVEVVYLKNYAIIKNKELLIMSQKVYDICKSKIVDVNTIAKFSRTWLHNTLSNIIYVNNSNSYLLSDLENKFKGQTALVAAAGPSLNDNIDKIKANRGKLVIFAVNKVAKYLVSKGIIPDFVVCLDAKNMQRTLGEVSQSLNSVNCITDIRTDCSIQNFGFKKVFYNFNDSDMMSKKIAQYNPAIKLYETGGSASTFALAAACNMGFSKIIMAGIDLAFKDDVIYADGQVMNKVSQNEMRVDDVNKNIVSVKSVKGDMVNTREDYEVFIKHFNLIVKNYGNTNIFNISSFGALIEGVSNVSFDAINIAGPAVLFPLNDVKPFKINLKEFAQDELCKINDIIEILSQDVFSPSLVSAIVKSTLVYHYMQGEILQVLQLNFEKSLAEDFIENTKMAIKTTVEFLQKYQLI